VEELEANEGMSVSRWTGVTVGRFHLDVRAPSNGMRKGWGRLLSVEPLAEAENRGALGISGSMWVRSMGVEVGCALRPIEGSGEVKEARYPRYELSDVQYDCRRTVGASV
jgi:hypothetical protein